MRTSIFLDVNVWIALSLRSHQYYAEAWAWHRSLTPAEQPVFCRVTQLAYLRLLTTRAVLGADTLSQVEAWAAYDNWMIAGGAGFLEEPLALELEFRFQTQRATPSPKEWADSYLVAFAASRSIELVTFDRALAGRYARAILLGS